MYKLLFTDPHFTDHPADNDRWDIFPWLDKTCKTYSVKEIHVLGDITEEKDKHSSVLVNKLFKEFNKLASNRFITILMGNHDYYDFHYPFFEFINNTTLDSGIKFIKNVYDGVTSLWLPHTKNWKEDWKDIDFSKYNTIYLHQTIEGAKNHNGILKGGIPNTVFDTVKSDCLVVSGDVHHFGQVQLKNTVLYYPGSPYPTKFGDISGKVALLNDNKIEKWLEFPHKNKIKLIIGPNDLDKFNNYQPNDKVKVTVNLTRLELLDYDKIKKNIEEKCKEVKLELCGIKVNVTDEPESIKEEDVQEDLNTKETVFTEFIKLKNLEPELVACGMNIFNEVKGL